MQRLIRSLLVKDGGRLNFKLDCPPSGASIIRRLLMSDKIKWKKKNGNELETNDLDATIKYMESIGAVRMDVKKAVDEVKSTTKFKKINPDK